jgi:hypothetical protein
VDWISGENNVNRGYLLAEGPQDAEFLGRLIRKTSTLKRLHQLDDVESFWQVLIPKTFPHKGRLLERVPVPTFYSSDTHSVAVDWAGGFDRILPRLQESLEVLKQYGGGTFAVGILLDADTEPAEERYEWIKRELVRLKLDQTISLPDSAGRVHQGAMRCGVFILPDNVRPGTLEEILEVCAQTEYPDLLKGAREYVEGVDPSAPIYTKDDLKDFGSLAGKKKALVASVASVLRPGRSIQTSIHDNRWVSQRTVGLPEVAPVRDFLRDLLALGS